MNLKTLLSFTLIIIISLLTGCAETSNDNSADPLFSAVARTSVLVSGDNDCPNGGILVESGIDENGNGLLEDEEVDTSEKVCNGTDGQNGTNGANGVNALVNQSAESAGANCTSGGIRIDAGLDNNPANGVLDAPEISTTEYVCNGSDGSNGSDGADGTNGTDGANGTNGLNALVSQTAEPAGINCAFGGVRFEVGIDSDSSGILESGEVTSTEYICETQNPLADNARLDDIRLSVGQLDQLFQSSQSDYTGTVSYLTSSVQITADSEDENASLTIASTVTASGTPSDPIALSEGGNSIVIEVTAEDGTSTRSYTVNIVRQNLQNFAQQAYVKASNTDAFDAFGLSAALSGNTLAVGAPGESSNAVGVNGSNQADNSLINSGAVYVFTMNNGIWSQQAYLKASNADSFDEFGISLSLYGDTLAVGARGESSNGTGVNSETQLDNSMISSGAVYVFKRTSGIWSQQAYIKASNSGDGDHFGNSVALYGNTLAVGASRESSNGTGVNSVQQADNSSINAGAVYIFGRTSGVWSQQAYVKASNSGNGDEFGFSLALSEDTLAVGARGEDSNSTGVNSGSESDNSSDGSGAVYVFARTDNIWSQQAYVKAFNTGSHDSFGYSLALSGDTLAVGALVEDSSGLGVNSGAQLDNTASDSGAVYIFTRNADVWSQQAYVKAFNTDSNDGFGQSVALSGHTLAVSARLEDSIGVGLNSNVQLDNSNNNSGAVYVFTRTGSTWSQQSYIKASNSEIDDEFGISIAMSGNTLAVGAFWEDSNGIAVNGDSQADNTASDSGSVYLFR